MRIRRVAALIAAFALTGCYHAVIQTGRPESTDVISLKWANSFVYGIVPPAIVETADTTVVVHPRRTLRVDALGNFEITFRTRT